MTDKHSAWCDKCWYRRNMNGYLSYCAYIFLTGHMRPCPGGEGCTARVTRKVYRKKVRTPEEREAFAEAQKLKKREKDRGRYQKMTEEQREQKREKCREYYASHKAEMDARHAAWYQANKARAAAYQRERRRKKKEARG